MTKTNLLRHIKGPFKADFIGGYIHNADGLMFAQVRGWGQLTYEEEPSKTQDAHLQYMVDALNEKFNSENGLIDGFPPCIDCEVEPGSCPEGRCRDCDLNYAFDTWPQCECGALLVNDSVKHWFKEQHTPDCSKVQK